MSEERISDERLNAFLDGQLDEAEKSRVFEALGDNPALHARACELRSLKELVKHAYDRPPKAQNRDLPKTRLFPASLAATLLLALGGASGWFAHEWLKESGQPVGLAWSPMVRQPLSGQRIPGVVIQVSDSDPRKWVTALNNARNLQQILGKGKVDIEIVAYGPGLEMLKRDSLVGPLLAEAARDGVRLLACGNTMRNTNTPRSDIVPVAHVVKAGIVEVMEKQQQGYSYIRP